MEEQYKQLHGCIIHSVVAVNNAREIENMWADSYRAYCAPVPVKSKNQTQLFTGISEEEAEQRLIVLCQESKMFHSHNKDIELKKQQMTYDLEMKDKELAAQRHQLDMKDKEIESQKHELEWKRIELESQRIQLQILQMQHS